MSEWKKVKLGELCDFINGGAWSDKEYVSEGIPVLKVTNCKNSGFSLSELSYLPYSLEQKYIQNKLQRYDVIIATVGSHPNLVNSSAGRSVIANSFVEGFYLNQNAVCIRTKDEDVLDQLFWGYYSKYYLFQHYIQMRGKGAANQMRIAISAIKEYPMPLPSINVQRHIASILFRYDSLIENYQKQIKLLEEAAQRLYKEWFVDLHFPGHENTKIVDGVPEGWEKKAIGDIVVYYDKQRKPLSSMQRMNMEKIYPYYGAAALMDYVDNYLFDGIYLLLGEDGTVITPDKFPVLQYVWGRFWVNNHAHVLRGKEGISTEFLYSMFKEMPIADIVTGAAQPKISQGRLSEKKILMPSLKLIQKWSSIAKHFFDKLRVLSEQIRLLTEARDRLLPKLMSGEIAV